jgi:hypothetical protein
LRHSALVFFNGKAAATAPKGTVALASQAEKILIMWRRFIRVTWWIAETRGFMTQFVKEGQKLQGRQHWLVDCHVF